MAYDAGGGKWVAGCVQNVETRDGTHTWSLEISDSFMVALTLASDDRSRMLLRSPVGQKRFKIVCVIV